MFLHSCGRHSRAMQPERNSGVCYHFKSTRDRFIFSFRSRDAQTRARASSRSFGRTGSMSVGIMDPNGPQNRLMHCKWPNDVMTTWFHLDATSGLRKIRNLFVFFTSTAVSLYIYSRDFKYIPSTFVRNSWLLIHLKVPLLSLQLNYVRAES